MVKRIFVFMSALMLTVLFAFPSFAQVYGFLDDGASLLTEEEKRDVLGALEREGERAGCTIAVATFDSIGGDDPADMAEEYYNKKIKAQDGVLLILVMDTRDWYAYASGTCYYASADYAADDIVDYLSDGDYAEGFEEFAVSCADRTEERLYRDYLDSNPSLKRKVLAKKFILPSIAFGLVFGGITVAVMRGKMKNTSKAAGAASYIVDDSMNVTDGSEIFLYMTTSVQSNHENESDGGRDSSDSSSGGHGGKF